MRKLLNTVAVIGTLAIAPSAAIAGETTGDLLETFTSVSEISVPLSIDLETVQGVINAQVPRRLATISENNMKCVEAKWAIVDLLIGTVKTKISPDLYCDVRGHVDRRGDMLLSGDGSKIQFSVPIHASVTADVEIGQETAKADATIFVQAIPNISPDWTPMLDVQTTFRWDMRPTIKLFDLIKITIGDKVEPKLKEELAKLEASLPDMLATLDVRSSVEALWMEVQEPVQIAENPSVYAVFKPTGVGFSGLNVVGKDLNAQVSIRGKTSVIVGEKPVLDLVPLLPLESIEPSDGRFSFAVPAVIEATELQNIVDAEIGEGVAVDIEQSALTGQFSAKNVKVGIDRDNGLRVSADVAFDNRSGWLKAVDVFDWFDFDGTVSLEIVPQIDPDTNTVSAASVRVASDTTSGLADTLVEVLNLPIVRDQFAELIAYDYSNELHTAMTAANEAIGVDLVPGVTIDGAIEAAGVEDLIISDGALMVVAMAEGRVAVQVSALSN